MGSYNININILETTWMQNKSKSRWYSSFREDLSRWYDLCNRIIWKRKWEYRSEIRSTQLYFASLHISIFRIPFLISSMCLVWYFEISSNSRRKREGKGKIRSSVFNPWDGQVRKCTRWFYPQIDWVYRNKIL